MTDELYRDEQPTNTYTKPVYSGPAIFVMLLTSFWSLFSAGYITAITFLHIPVDNVRFADTIVGFILGTVIATVLNFFYGSSSGSIRKDEIISNMVTKNES